MERTGKNVKRAILISLVLVIGTLIPVSARAAEPDFGQKMPVEKLLNEDGTLNLTTGFSGSLDLAGFVMVPGADGEPRFVPEGSEASETVLPADTD